MRVCSGSFTKGLKVKHSRLKGTEITISQAQAMMGNDRSSLEEGVACYPGDIIGVPNQQGLLSIGDTLYTGGKRISYTKIPSFSPEVFARCLCPSPSKAKNFNKGLDQLIAEGAVQMLRERGEEAGGGVPILAAVGPLQLEVVQSRMSTEVRARRHGRAGCRSAASVRGAPASRPWCPCARPSTCWPWGSVVPLC